MGMFMTMLEYFSYYSAHAVKPLYCTQLQIAAPYWTWNKNNIHWFYTIYGLNRNINTAVSDTVPANALLFIENCK